MILGCGQPCSAARLGNTRADHGGACGTVQLSPAPGGKYPHFGKDFTGGGLGTYGGQDLVGGETHTQSSLPGVFGYAGRVPERVARGGTEEREGGGGGGGGEDGGKQGGSKEPTEASKWERVVDLVQKAFREGRLEEEAMWQALVLIPKGEKEYRGIGLLEVM